MDECAVWKRGSKLEYHYHGNDFPRIQSGSSLISLRNTWDDPHHLWRATRPYGSPDACGRTANIDSSTMMGAT